MGNSLGLEFGKAPLTSPIVATNRTIRLVCGIQRYWRYDHASKQLMPYAENRYEMRGVRRHAALLRTSSGERAAGWHHPVSPASHHRHRERWERWNSLPI